MFSNLLNNAAKYTERGGRISLTARRQDGEAIVTVGDNGIGIPAENLPSIFELFSQARPGPEFKEGSLTRRQPMHDAYELRRAGYAGFVIYRCGTPIGWARRLDHARLIVGAGYQLNHFTDDFEVWTRQQPAAEQPATTIPPPSTPSTSIPMTAPVNAAREYAA